MDQASSEAIAFQAIEAQSGRSAENGWNDGASGGDRRPHFESALTSITPTALLRLI